MPHTVSEVTDMFWNIIRKQSALQNVWVRGRVAERKAGIFFKLQDLGNPDNKIECRIDGVLPVPPVGTKVFVRGSVILLRDRGEYRFSVTDIERETPETDLENQPVSVSDLTRTLRNSIRAHSVTVQGKIHDLPRSLNDFILLVLKNADPNGDGIGDVIECTLRPRIARNFSSEQGDRIRIEGQFTIFPRMSRYQITTRSIRVLPDGFQDDEAQVVREVKSYFSELRQEFSTARECEIQMGVSRRRADIVLIDPEGSFAAIAECKPENVVRYGPDQLKSYLCATDTRFGVFANSTNPDTWVFYENLRHNRFQQIERSEFETRVVQRPGTHRQLQDRIRELESRYERLESQIRRLTESD